jgi:hypothetical protein
MFLKTDLFVYNILRNMLQEKPGYDYYIEFSNVVEKHKR